MSLTAPFRSLFQRGFQSRELARSTPPIAIASPQMPEAETAFWHRQYRLESYFVAGRSFDQYYPAYQLGWRAARSHQGTATVFESLDCDLNQQWLLQHGSSLLEWNQVKLAVKAAWERGNQPQLQDVMSLAAGKKLSVAQDAARQFRQSSVSYLACGSQNMHSEALRRFMLVSAKLLTELEALPVEVDSRPFANHKSGPHMLERSRQAWRDSGFLVADRVEDVLAKLRNWLNAVEMLCQEVLPAQARKLLQHHVLVLRGQLQAVQWLSYGQA